MNINQAFPSGKFLKAEDLQGRIISLKIASINYEKIGTTDTKLVMYFVGKEKGMVLNKTNARTIAEAYGDDTDNWTGGAINVFSMKVDFQGKMVDGLRVKIPPRTQPQRAPTQQPQSALAPARATVMPNARQEMNPQAPAMATADDADPFMDDVPF